MPEGDTFRDWTSGPAKWFAVGVLATLSTGALAWSIARAAGDEKPRVSRAETNTLSAVTDIPSPQPVVAAQQQITAHVADQSTLAPTSSPDSSSRGALSTPLARTVNINIASAAELELLPGIGPALAQRIIEARQQRGGFKNVDDLDDVRGIGPKLLAKLRDRVSVE